MLNRRLSRRAPLCLALIVLTNVAACLPPSAARTGQRGAELVVHEWGTFTSVAGRNGEALAWRPLSFESDLPSFVYSIDRGASWERGLHYPSKSSRFVTVRMETPLLYFYTKAATPVSVKVRFNGGTITEWYPRARASGATIEWPQAQVLPGAREELPHDSRPNHYYPARETEAAVLRVGGGEDKTEHEKFLFYRGVGDFALPLSVRVDGARVVVRSAAAQGVGKVILYERRQGASGFVVAEAPAGETRLERPALTAAGATPRAELKTLLVAGGLYEREAEAMLETWRDSWFEEGLRVFYVLPREAVDAILPLEVAPQPTEIARVLVGRAELITPEMERDVAAQLARFEDPAPAARDAARREIDKYGRFADTILGQVFRYAPDAGTQQRVQRFRQATAPRARTGVE